MELRAGIRVVVSGRLNDELHELTGKAERFAEANGYYCESLNDQADQITNWMLDLEEAMETR
jgi:hypothetical protein